MYKREKKKKANALIVTVSVMMVLSVLGISFVRIATIDQTSSNNSSLSSRANMIAISGIDQAVVKLRSTYESSVLGANNNWIYGIDDTDSANPYNDAKDTIGNDPSKIADDSVAPGIPMTNIWNPYGAPSYKYEVDINGNIRNVSGFVDNNTNVYTLKIFDTTSQLNLNTQIDAKNPTGTHPNKMATILDNLSRAVAMREPYKSEVGNTYGPLKGLGSQIIARRKTLGGFTSKLQLLGVTDGTETIEAKDLEYIWDYITIYPSPAEMAKADAGKRLYNTIKYSGTADQYNEDYRSPVNINTASWPVILALLAPNYTMTGGDKDDTLLGTYPDETLGLSWNDAIRLANKICKRRPFNGWEEFNEFMDKQIAYDSANELTGAFDANNNGLADTSEKAKQKIEAVKANFNPNVTLRRLNPDAALYQDTNKTDLQYYTTEFTFYPHGLFEITSLGEILNEKGVPIVSSKAYAVVRIFNIYRQSTQYDFELSAGDIDWAEDGTGTSVSERIKAGTNPINGFSSVNNMPTLSAPSYDFSTWSGGSGRLAYEGSKHFGYIQPTSYESYTGNSDIDSNYLFRADFNGSIDANVGGSKLHLVGSAIGITNVTSKTDELATPSLKEGTVAGDLTSDGLVFRDGESKTLAFSMAGNFPTLGGSESGDDEEDEDEEGEDDDEEDDDVDVNNNKGTLMFWLKFNKNWDKTKWRTIYYGHQKLNTSSGIEFLINMKYDPDTMKLEIEAIRNYYNTGLEPECPYEYTKSTVEATLEPTSTRARGVKPQEWYHFAFRWKDGTKMGGFSGSGEPISISGNFYPTDEVAEAMKGTTIENGNIDLSPASTETDTYSKLKPGLVGSSSKFYVCCIEEGKSASVTIDDIRVSSSTNIEDATYNPSRFERVDDEEYYGIFKTKFKAEGDFLDIDTTVIKWGAILFAGKPEDSTGPTTPELTEEEWKKLWRKLAQKGKLYSRWQDSKGKWHKKEVHISEDILDNSTVTTMKVNVTEQTHHGGDKKRVKSILIEVQYTSGDETMTLYLTGRRIEDYYTEKTREKVYDSEFVADETKLKDALVEWYEETTGESLSDFQEEPAPYSFVDSKKDPIFVGAESSGYREIKVKFISSQEDSSDLKSVFRSPIVDEITVFFRPKLEDTEFLKYQVVFDAVR